MAGRPEGYDVAPLRAAVPSLHRTALMLTGEAGAAEVVLTRALARLAHRAGDLDRAALDAAAVHAFLGLARRHRREDRLAVPGRADPADRLAALRPRQRAAAVLRHGLGRSAAEVASALGASPAAASRLTPPDDGLAVLLDRLGASAPPPPAEDVLPAEGEVAGAPAGGPTGSPGRASLARRVPWRWLVAAALVVGLVVAGLALLDDQDGDGATAEPSPEGGLTPTTEMTERGWVLDAEGKAPGNHEGMVLLEELELDYGTADPAVELPMAYEGDVAQRFAVLWCDVVQVDDPHLQTPSLTLDLRGESQTIPCGGRSGSPAVPGLTPLPREPVLGTVPVTWAGDRPPRGEAVLAIYAEAGGLTGADDDVAPPPAPGDAVAFDNLDGQTSEEAAQLGLAPRTTRLVQVTHDSQLEVWSGGTPVTVSVDGVLVTDDGDLAAWDAGTAGVQWRTQDPELREGVWQPHAAGQVRTFALPEDARPAPGETTTVSVTGSGTLWGVNPTLPVDDVTWQVAVTGASASGGEPVAARPEPTPPELPHWSGGRRLLGVWTVPADGLRHPLDVTDPDLRDTDLRDTDLRDTDLRDPRAWAFTAYVEEGAIEPSDVPLWHGQGFGWVETGDGVQELWPAVGAASATSIPVIPSFTAPPPGGEEEAEPAPAPVVTSPSFPGQPALHVLVWAVVDYADFDFDAAAPPAEVAHGGSTQPLRSVTEEDLDEDGRVVLSTQGAEYPILRLRTQDRGRVRVTGPGGDTVPDLVALGGWWSSWTSKPAVVELPVWFDSVGATDVELTLQVEDYAAGFTIELFDGAG